MKKVRGADYDDGVKKLVESGTQLLTSADRQVEDATQKTQIDQAANRSRE